LKDRYLQVKTSEESKAVAKPPWKKITMQGAVHSSFLFRTAISKNIIPFGLIRPPLVVLPVVINFNKDIKSKQIRVLDWQEIKNLGYTETATFFKRAGSYWNKYKTEKSHDMSSIDRLNYQRGLTDQDLNKQYLVLYTASAKNANAVVLDRNSLASEFIVESTAYVFYTDNFKESRYVAACINSNIPNMMIKEFQATGLFGPRHVHKKILEVGFPKFDPNNNLHIELSELGLNCSKKSKEFIQTKLPAAKYRVGNVRTNFLKSIESEMASIDAIVTELLK
jgi:hypothetical protein